MGSCKKDLLHWQKVQQLNSNTTSRLNHIQFLGSGICIIAGGVEFVQSEIVRSVDGGYNFTASSDTNAPKEMFGMGLSANGNIYLSGVDGDVLHSVDSGKTWKFSRIDYLVYMGGSFSSPDTGIFVSSVLQRQCTITRVDSNFNIIDEQTFLFGLNNVYVASPTTIYIIGYGVAMKTINNGKTWNFLDLKGDNFSAMSVRGDEIWICGSEGGIYHSYDAGNSWETFRNGNDFTLPRYNLRSIVFKDSQNGWAAGDNGIVLHSDDGGKHWEEYDHFTTANLRSIVLCPNGDLMTAGDGGALYRIVPQ